jgi:parvulin-like peptidyl-prolyl isomerase
VSHLIVNGEEIAPERIQAETSAVARLLAEQITDEDPLVQRLRAREWAEENLIEDELLRQAAWSDPEPVPAEAIEQARQAPPDAIQGQRESAGSSIHEDSKLVEEQLRRQRLIQKITSHISPPRRPDVISFYRAHQNDFFSPEMVHAAHIIRNVDEQNDETAARAAIDQVQAELAHGRPFGEVADEMSNCPGRGGDLGFFRRGQMVLEFDAVVFELAPGEVSGVFRTEFGFHIAKVLEKRPEGILPFELVREHIEQHLMVEKRQAALHRFVDDLRAKADVRKVKDRSGV